VRAPWSTAGKQRPGKGDVSRVCGHVETLHRNKSLDLASYSQTKKSSISTLSMPIYGPSPNFPTPSLIPTSLSSILNRDQGKKTSKSHTQ